MLCLEIRWHSISDRRVDLFVYVYSMMPSWEIPNYRKIATVEHCQTPSVTRLRAIWESWLSLALGSAAGHILGIANPRILTFLLASMGTSHRSPISVPQIKIPCLRPKKKIPPDFSHNPLFSPVFLSLSPHPSVSFPFSYIFDLY